MEELKQKIVDLFKSEDILTLATVSPEGNPMSHPVAYVSEGAVLYFYTYNKSRKVQNILKHPNVAYSIYNTKLMAKGDQWDKILSAQVEGTASIVPDEEKDKVVKMIIEKFPALKDSPPGQNSAFVKLVPKKVQLSDYSKGFGHMDMVEF